MVVVETYRGFNIMFSPNSEKFSCVPSDEDAKESKSFAACKQHIDDYLKHNQNFAPFDAITNPENYGFSSRKIIKIIGIRKDEAFIYEELKEGKQQLSKYSEKDYIINYPENANLIQEYIESENREREYANKEKEIRKQIVSKMKIKTLFEYKKELLGK